MPVSSAFSGTASISQFSGVISDIKASISLFSQMVRSVFSVSDGMAVIFCAFENVPEPWKISGAPVAGASGRDPQPQRRTVAELLISSEVFFFLFYMFNHFY